mmetsp:Transcript_39434/g.121964  ORF Transcript_39434/g.121964 Transcript_39434/m.121964 type:complete len:217 (-) Transcript_39434:441-1091(-)
MPVCFARDPHWHHGSTTFLRPWGMRVWILGSARRRSPIAMAAPPTRDQPRSVIPALACGTDLNGIGSDAGSLVNDDEALIEFLPTSTELPMLPPRAAAEPLCDSVDQIEESSTTAHRLVDRCPNPLRCPRLRPAPSATSGNLESHDSPLVQVQSINPFVAATLRFGNTADAEAAFTARHVLVLERSFQATSRDFRSSVEEWLEALPAAESRETIRC